MLAAGAVNVRKKAESVNALNVFPVPDGDTGENMSRTMEGGAAALEKTSDCDIGKAAATAARGMLLAARGNSGVILSQFFDGVKIALAGFAEIGVKELKTAFMRGAERAREAVVKPTEGTILTVMRDAASAADKVSDAASAEEYLEKYIEEAEASILRTPELLPVLKEAGVVDSGGVGFKYIIDGMYEALAGDAETAACAEEQTDKYVVRAAPSARKKYACVAVADGDGLIEQMRSLGADAIVYGKQTMNPSTSDFLTAFDEVNADNIFVFPNNSNVIMAARAAAQIYSGSNVVVIESKTLAEGYCALSMLDYSSDNCDAIAAELLAAASGVSTGSVTRSVRDCEMNGKKIKRGDFIGLTEKTLVASSEDMCDCVKQLIDSLDKSERSVVIAMRGKDCPDGVTQFAEEYINKTAPELEFYEFYGGQSVYSLILAAE